MFGFNFWDQIGNVPASLGLNRLKGERERMRRFLLELDPERRLQSDLPPVWKRDFEPDVMRNLSRLSYGKCAFCERKLDQASLQPYRFRPPGYARPTTGDEGRICYLWLAFNWWNLFPICAACRPGDASFFPVQGRRDVPNAGGAPRTHRGRGHASPRQ